MPKTQKKPELKMSDFGVKREFYQNHGDYYVCLCGSKVSCYGADFWPHIKKCTVAQEFYDFRMWKGSQEYRKFEEWKNSRMPLGKEKK